MAPESHIDAGAARSAAVEAIAGLLESGGEDVLRSLFENPAFDETHLCLLLQRKDLPGLLLEEICKRKSWLAVYRVRLALAAHPHTPRLIAMRLLRELHLMDLVRIGLLPASPMELRRLADERVLAQLPQLPMGQKLALARRGSARIAAGLIAHGPEQVARVALDNSFLTEAQLLKTLAKPSLSTRILAVVANHEKWRKVIHIRVALLRHPQVPLERVPALAAGLPRRAVEDLLDLTRLPESVRAHLCKEPAAERNET